MIQTLKNNSFLLNFSSFISILLLCYLVNPLFSIGYIKILVFVHVALGTLAFFSGGLAMATKKGSRIHKKTGKMFYHLLVISVLLSTFVAFLPDHQSPTMISIGVLTIYLLIGGYRSTSFKKPNHSFFADRLLALTVILVSLLVIAYSYVIEGQANILRTVFGSIGIVFGLIDLYVLRKSLFQKRFWLPLHISKMISAFTASLTAVMVAQKILSGYYDWFLPTVIAIFYIASWLIKNRKKYSLIVAT